MSGKRLIVGIFLLMTMGGSSWSQDKKAAPKISEEDELKQLEAHFASQFRKLYRYEMSFMRIATDLNKQQFEKIAAECEPAMMESLRSYVKKVRNKDRNPPNPKRSMIDSITKAVQKQLSAEQAARYQKEIDYRTASNKRMAVAVMVVKFDKTLVLSGEQRRKLTNILEGNWDDLWNQFANEGQDFPEIPDEKIVPILTEPQNAVWKSVVKHKAHNYWGFWNEDLEEEVWPDDVSKKVESPDPKEKPPANGGAKP
jgi:hypothetical protein